MRPALLLPPILLPLLLPLAACSGGSWTYHSDGYTTFTSSSDGVTTSIQYAQGDNSRQIRVIGKVDLSEDGSDVRLLGSGASFGIKEDGWDGKRRLDISRGDGGASLYRYQIDGVEQEFDAAGRAWFAGVVAELHRKTSVGAAARAERLLAEGGPDGLLAAVAEVESSNAIRIYIGALLKLPDLSSAQLVAAVDVAAAKVSSSSGLEEILVDVAGERGEDEALTVRIVEAAGGISSSSSHGAVLQAVARDRRLNSASARPYYRSAAAISSSSTKEEVLSSAISYAPRDDASMGAYFDAADSISSSSSHGAVLDAALLHGELGQAGRLRWLQSVGKISSTSTREELLTKLLRTTPHDAVVLTAALGVVRQLSSSSSQESCVRAFLSRDGLDKPLLRQAEQTIDTISSSSTRETLRDVLIEKMFALGG